MTRKSLKDTFKTFIACIFNKKEISVNRKWYQSYFALQHKLITEILQFVLIFRFLIFYKKIGHYLFCNVFEFHCLQCLIYIKSAIININYAINLTCRVYYNYIK